ncbi:MAG: methylmalonyl-CoA mutase family protein [Bacteroidota bacterium]|nr:methylmalonyl-CoA mutase family protein [Bacteroidota bacterium]
MSVNKKQKIFEGFDPFSKAAWIDLIMKDLNENKTMDWSSEEEIEIAPFYTKEDVAGMLPLKLPTQTKEWKYLELLDVYDNKKSNKTALDALQNGADGLIINLEGENEIIFPKLFENILPEHCIISFKTKAVKAHYLNDYFKFIDSSGSAPSIIEGSLYLDPIAAWTLNPTQKSPDFQSVFEILNLSKAFKNFHCFSVTTDVYKNSGASIIQEAALFICSFIQYVKEFSKQGIDVETIFQKVSFHTSIGTNFFHEIAKIRALKSLTSQIAASYKIKNFAAGEIPIHGETGWWTKTAKDPHSNILRNTTEAMSGILGGCSTISILPFDVVFGDHNELSRRVARNISNILKEEAYFNKVPGAVSGSYYLENLTYKMLDKIWLQVQEIESEGGFINAFNNGYIKSIVEPNYRKSVESVLKASKKVVGSNAYINQYDKDTIRNLPATNKGWFEYDRLTAALENQ